MPQDPGPFGGVAPLVCNPDPKALQNAAPEVAISQSTHLQQTGGPQVGVVTEVHPLAMGCNVHCHLPRPTAALNTKVGHVVAGLPQHQGQQVGHQHPSSPLHEDHAAMC